MRFILANILTIVQHLSTLQAQPEQYKPEQCPHCFKPNVWGHGVYYRQAACENDGRPIPIPRHLCCDCNATFSTLPECIPPRRWYHWTIQEMALLSMAVKSLMETWNARSDERLIAPCIATLQRWSSRLDKRFLHHKDHLCQLQPQLQFTHSWKTLWPACLAGGMSLSGVMVFLNRAGEIIP